MKKTFHISLITNKYFFVGAVIFLLTILTAINNYYFYDHVKKSTFRNANQLEGILENQLVFCRNKKNKISRKRYRENMKMIVENFSQNAYYNDTLVLKHETKGFIWEKNKNGWDKVVASHINIIIPKLKSNDSLVFNSTVIFNNALYFNSIVRSMTFSIFEWIPKLISGETLHWKTYWYRSRPAVGFLIFTFILLFIVRKREEKMLEIEEKHKQEMQKKDEEFKKELQKQEEQYQKQKKTEAIFEIIGIPKEYEYGLRKYRSIFIDEIQDYSPEWLYIIKNYILEENGELVLFGDEKQNLYHKENNTSKINQMVNDFTKCHYLKQATRQLGNGDRILDLSKKFQKAYFSGKYELDDYKNQINQLKLEEGIFKVAYYNNSFDPFVLEYDRDIEKMIEIILKEVKDNNIHNNDYCILSSRIDILKEIDYILRTKYNLKTMTTFESKERYITVGSLKKNPISDIHRNKKLHFWSNSGTIKLATVHSYKGFESQTVFLILNDRDNPEQVYAGFTRSKSNLMVFIEKHSEYKEFFRTTLNKYESVKKEDDILQKLYDCINYQLIIDIEYKQYSSIQSIKNIKPYKILFMNGNFYLACEVDNEYKFTLYRVSNILNIETFDKTFNINIELDDFIAHIQTPFATYKENYREHLVNVIVEIEKSKAHYFENKSFLASQKILKILKNGNLLVSFKVTQELEVEELIKKWLPFIKVIEPLTLDEKIKADIRKYLQN